MTQTHTNTTLKGLVFNIQRFSVHDGPGIRTTVFMKGCPLTCRWCSNPESQYSEPQLITRDVKCTGCGVCAETCPINAIQVTENSARTIDWNMCDQCLQCVDACVYSALTRSGEYMEVATVFEEVMSDRLFYKNSGGGITISGGEPLLQKDFVIHLLEICKHEGLHTAVDTTGHVTWETIQSVLPWTDLLLWDIKHLNETEHERTTGVSNRLILENLNKASTMTKVWLRIPLIHGFNDTEDHIDNVITLARKVSAEKISLLPYHEGGRSKSNQIGREYPDVKNGTPSEDKVDHLRGMITKAGITVGIGN